MTPWTKRLAILLAVSVGLNVLLAGFWIGRHFGRPPARGGGPDAGHELGQFGRRHPVLRTALERHGDEFRARREATRRARREAREALASAEFDRSRLERALANLKHETAKNQELTHRAILEAAVEAHPEQRKALGRALEPHEGRDKKGR